MSDNEFPFSEDFQFSILKLMILDDFFLVKASSHIKEEYFNNKYLAWAFRAICKYHEDYHKSPSISTLENEARKYEVEKQPAYFKVLEQILQSKSVEPEYVRRELTGFIRRNIFVESHKAAANLYNSKNTEGAFEFTRKKMDELLKVDFEKDDVVDFGAVMEDLRKAEESKTLAVPTGIDIIDDAMNGGMAPGTLTTLLSGTNAGKSMALINMGYWAFRAGKKVVSIHHEDEELPTKLRVYSRLTRIPYNKLLSGEGNLDSDEIEKLKIAAAAVKKRWQMTFMYGAETSVEDVRDWLRLKKKEFDFDLVIDDYGQFIRTRRTTEGERFTQAIVYRTLKQIALELNVSMLTCAQGNREAQKVSKKGLEYLKSTDLAECFEIARVSSNVITLNRSDDQQNKNQLVYYLEKQRSGIVGVAVKCFTDYSKCITHDSTKLSTPNEQELGLIRKMWVVNSLNPLLSDEPEVKDNSGNGTNK